MRVEPTGIINRLEEDLVQLVDLGTVGRSIARRLIDGFKGNEVRFTGQLGPNLTPEAVEFLFNHGKIGSGLGNISPIP